MLSDQIKFSELKILHFAQDMTQHTKFEQILIDFGIQPSKIQITRKIEEFKGLISKQTHHLIILDDCCDADLSELMSYCNQGNWTKNNRIPVLLVCSHGDESSRKQAKKAGVDAYLAKPINPKELYLRFQILLSKPKTIVETRRNSQNSFQNINISSIAPAL